MAAIVQPLRDRVGKDMRVLLVGINPGIRSAAIGHHFAGHSNRFWKLLHESGLVSEPLGTEDDVRLPEWSLGITNLISRATPGIDTLRREEYAAGERILRRKVRRWRPKMVAFVGVSLYRAILTQAPAARATAPSSEHRGWNAHAVEKGVRRAPQVLGRRPETFEGALVFVLPNPSGRNANFTYVEMLAAFRTLAVAAGAL